MSNDNPSPPRYRAAGVDIDSGHRLVERIRPAVAKTHRPGVMGGLGGFGGLFELPAGYRRPVLVAGTDGVGTKLLLARPEDYPGLGVDLVAMCANDVAVTGAEPLFFLDYYATGQLDVYAASALIEGIAAGCREAGMALIGGETAEMPGLYGRGEFDVAGFCVGIAEADALLGPQRVAVGDALVALGSSGPHANGFSLIRKLLAEGGIDLDAPFEATTLRSALMAPTKLYVAPLHKLIRAVPVHAAAHITGGGLMENLPRALPDDTVAVVDPQSFTRPAVFRWLRDLGVEEAEMRRVFNCGVGLVICVPASAAQAAVATLTTTGERAWILGHVAAGRGPAAVVWE
ncbi:MAG: phosphoribosylformylglycinamidine cyclo-ligase [Candidatus Competibacterales bacterium]